MGEQTESRKSPRKFTWQELSQLNQRHNAHVAVRGKVYDVSGFIDKHPGGANQLLLGAGRDITVLFESYHKFSNSKVLEKFYVGELVTNELPVFPEPGQFYRTLRERVDQYFKENEIDPKISYWMFLRYLMFFLTANMFWVGMMLFHEVTSLGVVMAIGWGFFAALIAMTCLHDASHFSITHKPWVWSVVGSLHDFYQGTSTLVWLNQHTLGHHPYTNIDGADPDIVTATVDIRRIKWSQGWMSRYFYQHIYIPLLYCVLGIKTRLQDFYILYKRQNGNIRMNPPSTTQLFLFFAGKLTHCLYRFLIPCLFMPWTSLLLYNVVGEVVLGYWLALIFQASHVVSEVEWPKPDPKDLTVQRDWAEMQVETTQDYATDSWFWTVFTGALNHQTSHHLFPGVNQAHYPLITPILQQTCREFGVSYHHMDSAWDTFHCHFNHLKTLGQTASGDDSSSQHSLKTSRTTDSRLGTSLFSELDSQYSLPMRLQNYAMHGT